VPKEIALAARASRTIRFQRVLIHRFAAAKGYEIGDQASFLWLASKPASAFIAGALAKAAGRCPRAWRDPALCCFLRCQGWRSHAPMRQGLREAGIEALPRACARSSRRFDAPKGGLFIAQLYRATGQCNRFWFRVWPQSGGKRAKLGWAPVACALPIALGCNRARYGG
jgi:hypothetical protein